MKIFKFGGASVKDANSVRNVAEILKRYQPPYVVVVSAMGKTTNALEKVVELCLKNHTKTMHSLQAVQRYHLDIAHALFGTECPELLKKLNAIFRDTEKHALRKHNAPAPALYDRIVSAGELLSTLIVSAWLNKKGVDNNWVDARSFLITDERHRQAEVNWEETRKRLKDIPTDRVLVTQGFIGATADGKPTTLGREGSDFSAAILAHLLDAAEVIIWKDVPGMLNADPRRFRNTQKLNNISYREAIELAYYGASVIHPKTIKPLQNKSIPLWIKSFVNPNDSGTLINENTAEDDLIPSYIYKEKQALISISPRDFTFIMEDNLSDIFSHFSQFGVHINLMQHSAINFSVCVDDEEEKIPALIHALQKHYAVLFNKKIGLLTVRHYDEPTLKRLIAGKQIMLEQKTRHTARIALRED